MCTHDGNTNKGCYIPTDIYIGIFSVPDHPGYLVRWITPTLTHPIWCNDMHLSGTFVCFTTQGILFYLPNLFFKKQENIIFVWLFINIWNTPPCSPKYDRNIWLYSAVYRVAVILDRGSSLVATHCTADVWVTLDRPGTTEVYSQLNSQLVYLAAMLLHT